MSKIILVYIALLLGLGFVLGSFSVKGEIKTVQLPLVCPEAKSCEVQTITKDGPERIVIKEVPVEKIIYRDKIIYQTISDQDCRIDLANCNAIRGDLFNSYSQSQERLKSYLATTTRLRYGYRDLLNVFESMIYLVRDKNTTTYFDPQLTSALNRYEIIASSSEDFLGQ